ncbi:DUF115 domain-containing protein [Brevibacillus agri]|uniref:motility associated factor glycosyltransferase family protein n=1 Tax=Brevibacillus agri TaxID=51101 RepID=UPI002E1F2595|nr:DUF115 domain-containing protein [Brevibacillus agri]MED1655879.1 DUF115 domain-containing protein [Brevibacillus agri]MED1685012.1 DUF115 domain-containing protein [Brevibacillus agri]MED1693615.1 DUF115 domain-containing protein [Brevibacillus agri]MED1697571.1 DUF115 domain-containing protein [Brevibacillus agri]
MSNPVLEKNLEALENNKNHHIEPFDSSKVKYEIGREGKETIVVRRNEFIRYNLKEITPPESISYDSRGVYFISGLMDIGVIQGIYNRADKNSPIIIVEPNPEVFFYLVSNYDFCALFEKKNVFVIIADLDVLPAVFGDLLLKNNILTKTSNIQFYASHYMKVFESEKVQSLQKQFLEIVKYSFFKIGNSTEDTMLGLLQNLINLKALCETLSVKKLKDEYKGKPAVVVAAGPSLEKNIHELLKIPRDQYLCFSVTPSLKKLQSIGIIPDAVFAIERIVEVYEYFFRDKNQIPENTIFVGPPVVNPEVLKQFPANRRLHPLKSNEQVNTWLNKLVSNQSDEFSMGISVAHLAFAFARYLGCDPIIIIGQDLAYGEGDRTHVEGTVYDDKKVTNRGKELYIRGYYGGEVKTREIWQNFLLWFEEEFIKTTATVVNATEGGAKIRNCVQMPLREALSTYCNEKVVPLHRLVDKYYKPLFSDEQLIMERVQNEIQKLNEFKTNLETYLDRLTKIEERIAYKKDDEDASAVFNELGLLDADFQNKLSALSFMILFIQTHLTIAALEYNRLGIKQTVDKSKKMIESLRKLYTTSYGLTDLVSHELEKFLKTF